jgi:anti-sigma factor RsiW
MAESAHAVEKLIVQYLLGELPEERQAAVEDRAFADSAYLADIQAVEADLIDAYVRGELTAAERRAFERMFLASPARRSKVAFARTLARLSDEHAKISAPLAERTSGFRALLELIRGWNPAAQFAGGLAALICIAGVGWLAVQDRAMRSQVASLQERTAALTQEADSSRRQLEELRSSAAKPSLPVAVATLVLLPGVSRGDTRPVPFSLDASAQLARIEIQLEARDEFPRYRAELRTAGGEDVLSMNNLTGRRSAGGLTVGFGIAASALAPGRYELTLKGLPRNEPARDIGFYYFIVQRQ